MVRLGTEAIEGTAAALVRELVGPDPLRAIDVGARHVPLAMLAGLADRVELFAFEPDEVEADRLRTQVLPGQGWKAGLVLPFALADRSGTAELFLTREPSLSSLRRPDPAKRHFDDWDVVETRQVPVHALDDLMADGVVAGEIDYLKVDAQGGEWEVLRGASRALSTVDLVEVEVRFVQQYLQQRTFLDTALLMREQGFSLLGLEIVYYGGIGVDARRAEGPAGRRAISHGDALFVRTETATLPERRMRNLIGLLVAHGYPHEALRLAEVGPRELVPLIAAATAVDEHGWRERLALLKKAIAYAARPSRYNRFELAQRSATLHTGQRYSIPRLS